MFYIVLTIAAFLTFFRLLLSYTNLNGFLSFKNNYMTKGLIGSFIIKLIISIFALVIWFQLLNFILTPNSEKLLVKVSENNLSVYGFIALGVIWMAIFTSVIFMNILRYGYYTVFSLVRLKNQKKNTISNLMLKAIHNESDEVIVERYREMDKAPLLPYEEPNLTQAEEMKLISALVNMGEIETAKKLGKEFVRVNKKIVKNQVAFKKIGKSKKTLQARSSNK